MCAKRPAKLTGTMLVPVVSLLLSLVACMISCSTIPGNTTDVLALQDFKDEIIYDPTGALISWNSSISHCMWEGVRCSPAHTGRVVALELPGLNLAGQISPSIGNITFLTILNLSTNSLSGQLPTLNTLHKLQILDLGTNSLHDTIRDALTNCSDLRAVDLHRNNLVGGIPLKLSLLSNLSFLRLSWNNLTGTIPPALSNITHIQTLSLASNKLIGGIPAELGKLSNIYTLYLGDNNLSSEFPRALYNLSSLENLGLEMNELGGTLPYNIGDLLPNLQWLLLNQNMFQGQIPASLGNASRIYSLDLNNNNFTRIPSSFGKLQNLLSLNLESNDLKASDSQSWEFFNALTNCSHLQLLSLSRNQLYGPIPNSVGNLSTGLEKLLLSANRLFGMVPPSIGKLGGLLQLSLDNNHHLSGSIEEWIVQLTNLQFISLQYNKFTGTIPSSIGNITQLTQLILINNEFEGPLPPSLGKLLQLQYLDFAHNNFQGTIPKEISSLNQLVEIHLSSNKLTGEVPNTLNQCLLLLIIQLDSNRLTGTIPASIGNITGLSILNLSHNNLTGEIPTALSSLQLSELDLSYNDLQGEIPRNGVFSNATVVSLEGNLGLCGGAVDLHMPPCIPAISRKAASQYYIIRVLIPIFGFISVILLFHFILLNKKAPNKTYLMLLSFGKKFPKVSYKDLAQATANFSESNILGRGSYGSVYKGKLVQTKTEVAIKVFDLEMRCACKSFVSECDVMRSIRHRNLLPILTACSTIDSTGNAFKALIYEFMPNGNLDTWLHYKCAGQIGKGLGLAQRISIAVNIADGLAYLHNDIEIPIVHCDLKPSNILLDGDMNAYVGDFGIANLVHNARSLSVGHLSSYSSSNTLIRLKGTIGYIAPEYAQSGQVSTQGDVYSFGIILLEMLTRRRPTDSMFENEHTIVTFVEKNFPNKILHIIDPHLYGECKVFIQAREEAENVVHVCLVSLLQVALSCVHLLPRERMNMRDVASKLQSIRTSYVAATKQKQVTIHIQ